MERQLQAFLVMDPMESCFKGSLTSLALHRLGQDWKTSRLNPNQTSEHGFNKPILHIGDMFTEEHDG